MTDIVERLRKVPQRVKEGFLIFWSHDYPLCREAADTIEAQRAENARLRAALKPFAEQYDAVEKEFGMLLLPDDANSMVRYADLRAARAAMGETE